MGERDLSGLLADRKSWTKSDGGSYDEVHDFPPVRAALSCSERVDEGSHAGRVAATKAGVGAGSRWRQMSLLCSRHDPAADDNVPESMATETAPVKSSEWWAEEGSRSCEGGMMMAGGRSRRRAAPLDKRGLVGETPHTRVPSNPQQPKQALVRSQKQRKQAAGGSARRRSGRWQYTKSMEHSRATGGCDAGTVQGHPYGRRHARCTLSRPTTGDAVFRIDKPTTLFAVPADDDCQGWPDSRCAMTSSRAASRTQSCHRWSLAGRSEDPLPRAWSVTMRCSRASALEIACVTLRETPPKLRGFCTSWTV